MRFVEQATTIYSTAKDSKQATTLVEHLMRVFFVDPDKRRADKMKGAHAELLDIIKHTYSIDVAGGRGYLSIKENDG